MQVNTITHGAVLDFFLIFSFTKIWSWTTCPFHTKKNNKKITRGNFEALKANKCLTSLAIKAYAGLMGGVGRNRVKSQCPFLNGLWGAELRHVRSVATEWDVETERGSKEDCKRTREDIFYKGKTTTLSSTFCQYTCHKILYTYCKPPPKN